MAAAIDRAIETPASGLKRQHVSGPAGVRECALFASREKNVVMLVVVSLLRVLTGPSTPTLKKTRFRAGPRRGRALERG